MAETLRDKLLLDDMYIMRKDSFQDSSRIFYDLSSKEIKNIILEAINYYVKLNSLDYDDINIDNYTLEHSIRVCIYSCQIAEHMKLPEYKIKIIQIASALHDVGKIYIKQELLNKPGKLNDDEYERIKLHPTFSKDILADIEGFDLVAELVYCHHEHYAGTGYPRGLKEDEIPLEAHIIQLCDSYDAMTSDRPYRKAMTNQRALEILEEEKGRQFHPDIVNAALDLFKEAI